MKAAFKKITAALAVALVSLILGAVANAGCGDIPKPGVSLQPQAWQGMGVGSASLLQVSENADAIVGFWQVTLTAKGNPGPPDDTVIDKGFSQFHSDGTEILNSSRAPVTQSFCLGVWKKVSPGHYKLNHFPISWDQNSNLVGVANIREDIFLSRDGKYSGPPHRRGERNSNHGGYSGQQHTLTIQLPRCGSGSGRVGDGKVQRSAGSCVAA